MVQTDSPFPPLKVEHRYRGVYERAGFDVNLGGSPTDANSIQIEKNRSPNSPAFPSHRAVSDSVRETYGHRNASSRSMPQKGSSPISGVPNLNPNRYQPPRKSPYSQSAMGNAPYPQSNDKYPGDQPYNYSYQQNNSLPNIAVSTERKIRNEESDFETQSKNVKNLQLHIHDSNYANFQPDQTESSSSTNSQTFENFIDKPSTPNTSASSNEVYVDKGNHKSMKSVDTTELYNTSFAQPKRLSQELDSFKQEVQGHKGFDHKGFDPRKGGSRRNRGPAIDTMQHLNNSVAEFLDNADSFQFNMNGATTDLRSSGSQVAEPAPQSEFQNFLLTSDNHTKPMLRYSQLSTVSSIISKNTDGNDPEEEIDAELQRQLDGLKNGDYVAEVRKESVDGTDSYFTANSSVVTEPETPIVPVIQVQDTSRNLEGSHAVSEDGFDSEDTPQPSIPSRRVSIPTVQEFHSYAPSTGSQESMHLDEFEQEHPSRTIHGGIRLHDRRHSGDLEQGEEYRARETEFDDSDDEEIAPLVSERNPARAFQPPYPTTPLVNDSQFDDSLNTPETIKPLSPKNHKIEEELKNMNFNYDVEPVRLDNEIEANVFDTSAELNNIDDLHDEMILLHNVPPEEFEAFPKSVMNLDAPNFRTSNSGTLVPPGTGPCRTCHRVVSESGRGSEKPIYSKSGDLSGQWHRGCFSCTYAGCAVSFNKNVSCYALLDNAFCQRHYHLLNGTLCQSCGNAIEGECIENELKQKWHVSCLKCSKCHKGISDDYFLIENEIVCENDAPGVITRLEKGGLLTSEKIEKRRTRILYLD